MEEYKRGAESGQATSVLVEHLLYGVAVVGDGEAEHEEEAGLLGHEVVGDDEALLVLAGGHDHAAGAGAAGEDDGHTAGHRITHQNVQVVRDGRSSEVHRAIVLWDKAGGGLGLSKAVADSLGRYTQALLEIARQAGQRSERERMLREDTAALLHRWAASVAPHTLNPEQTPVITEYGGVTFRSQLEARWAAYFDRHGIAWKYEPARFDGWVPDFRLVLEGVEAYAEVKPVTEFPMDVAERVVNSGLKGDILILGLGSRHAWRYRGDGWTPAQLVA